MKKERADKAYNPTTSIGKGSNETSNISAEVVITNGRGFGNVSMGYALNGSVLYDIDLGALHALGAVEGISILPTPKSLTA